VSPLGDSKPTKGIMRQGQTHPLFLGFVLGQPLRTPGPAGKGAVLAGRLRLPRQVAIARNSRIGEVVPTPWAFPRPRRFLARWQPCLAPLNPAAGYRVPPASHTASPGSSAAAIGRT
jgi:hypothetical protein